ncbi:raffinose/stachyose/melibiose transport system permease protein [Arthrobacter sp. yr096]|uniref:carbohydrate ABC transporter permease n=1 Tax=unclassified Arthrobacter TaxID=235627 RepID=UPI00089A9760|nr:MULTISPECIES: carbohydrate ABC transporter permease [unclassified Arthrobacter]SDX56394.1 raffinose/stachyose/melibiose transport system permease protein [Arthrobacter sp. cf158]SEI84928.1 raffinose/stachyose/melibiose transport system permease protein [Arthrobacter sp. yr096]
MSTALKRYGLGVLAIAVSVVVFIIPLLFMVLTAVKDRKEAAKLDFAWPTNFQFVENFTAVLSARKFMLVTAFINSTILTVASVTILVILAAMVAWVLQRRKSRWNGVANFLILSGLIIPPAIVPTIWVLQSMGLFKTLPGLILIEVAFGLSFCVMLFRAFIASIPKELDEAAVIDGCGPVRLFFRVIFPLLRSVIITVIVVQSVHIFNDFQNPLYFLPGDANATVQLTLFNFQSQFTTNYNLLFMNILLITVPPFIMYLFFNRQIVAGMTAGAVKG